MKASEAVFAILDTETTGLSKADGDELVEVAVREWQYRYGLADGGYATLVNPGRPIPVMSSAVHHLTDRDVADAPDAAEAIARIRVVTGMVDAFIAHNVEFDRAFVPIGKPWLCAKRLAQHVVPLAPAHNNQVLRYYFGGADIDLEGQLPHRAMADVIVTAFNLKHIFEAYFEAGGVDDVATMIAYAESPIEFRALPFGKHRGEPINTVPESYLHWMLKSDLGPDMIYTAKTEITRRAKARNRGVA